MSFSSDRDVYDLIHHQPYVPKRNKSNNVTYDKPPSINYDRPPPSLPSSYDRIPPPALPSMSYDGGVLSSHPRAAYHRPDMLHIDEHAYSHLSPYSEPDESFPPPRIRVHQPTHYNPRRAPTDLHVSIMQPQTQHALRDTDISRAVHEQLTQITSQPSGTYHTHTHSHTYGQPANSSYQSSGTLPPLRASHAAHQSSYNAAPNALAPSTLLSPLYTQPLQYTNAQPSSSFITPQSTQSLASHSSPHHLAPLQSHFPASYASHNSTMALPPSTTIIPNNSPMRPAASPILPSLMSAEDMGECTSLVGKLLSPLSEPPTAPHITSLLALAPSHDVLRVLRGYVAEGRRVISNTLDDAIKQLSAMISSSNTVRYELLNFLLSPERCQLFQDAELKIFINLESVDYLFEQVFLYDSSQKSSYSLLYPSLTFPSLSEHMLFSYIQSYQQMGMRFPHFNALVAALKQQCAKTITKRVEEEKGHALKYREHELQQSSHPLVTQQIHHQPSYELINAAAQIRTPLLTSTIPPTHVVAPVSPRGHVNMSSEMFSSLSPLDRDRYIEFMKYSAPIDHSIAPPPIVDRPRKPANKKAAGPPPAAAAAGTKSSPRKPAIHHIHSPRQKKLIANAKLPAAKSRVVEPVDNAAKKQEDAERHAAARQYLDQKKLESKLAKAKSELQAERDAINQEKVQLDLMRLDLEHRMETVQQFQAKAARQLKRASAGDANKVKQVVDAQTDVELDGVLKSHAHTEQHASQQASSHSKQAAQIDEEKHAVDDNNAQHSVSSSERQPSVDSQQSAPDLERELERERLINEYQQEKAKQKAQHDYEVEQQRQFDLQVQAQESQSNTIAAPVSTASAAASSDNTSVSSPTRAPLVTVDGVHFDTTPPLHLTPAEYTELRTLFLTHNVFHNTSYAPSLKCADFDRLMFHCGGGTGWNNKLKKLGLSHSQSHYSFDELGVERTSHYVLHWAQKGRVFADINSVAAAIHHKIVRRVLESSRNSNAHTEGSEAGSNLVSPMASPSQIHRSIDLSAIRSPSSSVIGSPLASPIASPRFDTVSHAEVEARIVPSSPLSFNHRFIPPPSSSPHFHSHSAFSPHSHLHHSRVTHLPMALPPTLTQPIFIANEEEMKKVSDLDRHMLRFHLLNSASLFSSYYLLSLSKLHSTPELSDLHLNELIARYHGNVVATMKFIDVLKDKQKKYANIEALLYYNR